MISYSAKQRTREIGVRVAFGASERDVMRLILGQGLVVALAVAIVASFVPARGANDERALHFSLSRDWTQIAFWRGASRSDVVLIAQERQQASRRLRTDDRCQVIVKVTPGYPAAVVPSVSSNIHCIL